jgi:hypothetical protein
MQKKPLSRYWLLLGAAALAIAGLYSLVLVVARTPQLASLPLFKKLFHEALVVHVDLSVLVWFLAIACLLWSRMTANSRPVMPYIEEAALISMALGTLAIALSPLDPAAAPLMSNYIPVIYSPVFFLGLSLVMCGVLLMATKVVMPHLLRHLHRLHEPPQQVRGDNTPIGFALRGGALITLVALAAFVCSWRQMPGVIEGQQYYEMLFWGGGHLLQFTHVQMVMVCWLLLAKGLKSEFTVYPKHLYLLFAVGPIAALGAIPAYVLYNVADMGHRQFFTYLMILGNAIAPTILALWILPGVLTLRALRKGEKRALWSVLLMSFILFIYGGVLGALINGQNVVIPAHYHGSIVGVTLGFMGIAYLMLPQLGYRDVASWRLAYWQPIVYGAGQLMHISGLAYSGGYGVLRKSPGEIADIALPVKAALGFMGLGGLIAIVGGLMFVVVVFLSVRGRLRQA